MRVARAREGEERGGGEEGGIARRPETRDKDRPPVEKLGEEERRVTKSREIRSSVASRERWGGGRRGKRDNYIRRGCGFKRANVLSLSLSPIGSRLLSSLNKMGKCGRERSRKVRIASKSIVVSYLFYLHGGGGGAKGGEEGKQNYRRSHTGKRWWIGAIVTRRSRRQKCPFTV